jgi:hypothetical protein
LASRKLFEPTMWKRATSPVGRAPQIVYSNCVALAGA